MKLNSNRIVHSFSNYTENRSWKSRKRDVRRDLPSSNIFTAKLMYNLNTLFYIVDNTWLYEKYTNF